MELGIRGRKAVVCASSRGLGLGCAMQLAHNGVDLVINGLDAERLEKTAETIRAQTGVDVQAVAADISTAEGQARLLEACPAPDILVNNNGGPPRSQLQDLDRDKLLSGIVMNMVTPIELIRAVVPGMLEKGFGRIVNITSINVKMPVRFLELSAGSRAGLTTFCAGLARTLVKDNITINNILPGFFDTDRQRNGFKATAGLTGRSYEDLEKERLDSIPAGRFGDPMEFGRVCAFLCSAHSGYITSQNILVDGGRYEATF